MSIPAISDAILGAFGSALAEAERFRGATAPNPPVGAAALDSEGRLLGVAAHEKAGTAHAEAKLIQSLGAAGALGSVHTLVVTLEPCNHRGRTPPCTEAIAASGIREVVFGVGDPNPRVAGGGAEALRARGLRVRALTELLATHPARDPGLEARCAALIAPFKKWSTSGLPWITVKQALTEDGSMIPPPGQKTFTSPSSLKLAHELRRRSDAILTGSGTVLADSPLFTVRNVPDHPGKRRHLLVLDRRARVPESWLQEAAARGLDARRMKSLEDAFKFAGDNNSLEILVEAGPSLTQTLLQRGFWDEIVVITQSSKGQGEDRIETRLRGEY